MAALTELHRLFVLELADQKTMNYRQAYIKAGYSARSPGAVSVQSCRMAADQRTLDALEEVVSARIKMAVPMAVNVIAELASVPGKDQYRAAKDIADRGGHAAMQRIEKKVTHEAVLTEPQLLDSIRSLAALLEIDATKLIGSRLGSIIDGEFEELETEEDHVTEPDEGRSTYEDDEPEYAEVVEAASAVSFEGLEDLL